MHRSFIPVRWFGRSLHFAASPSRELPNQNRTGNHTFLVSFRIRSSQKSLPQNAANFGFGTLAGIAAICLATSLAPVDAQPKDRVQVGVLECRGGASIGFIVGSVTNLGCVLRVEGVPEDRYVATIRKEGLDLGITQETALAWAVYSPVARLGPGDLTGD